MIWEVDSKIKYMGIIMWHVDLTIISLFVFVQLMLMRLRG